MCRPRRRLFPILVLSAMLVAAACTKTDTPTQPEPVPWNPKFPGHPSFETLTTSNGLAVATVRNRKASAGQAFNLVDRLQDHIYAQPDEDTVSKDFMRSLYLGLKVDGQAGWLLNTEAKASYLPGTNIVHLVQTQGSLQVDTYVFAPFHSPGGGETDAHLLVVMGQVTNLGEPVSVEGLAFVDLDMAAPVDPHLETVTGPAQRLVESNGAEHFVLQNLSETGVRAAVGPPGSDEGPLRRVGAGQGFESEQLNAGPGGNLEVGLSMPVGQGSLAQDERGAFGLVLAYGRGASSEATGAGATAFVADRAPQDILQDEIDWWQAWHAKEAVPAGLHPYEAELWAQSNVVLKMGQVREPGRGHGQILASLVPGAWRIAWVRDMAYAIMGLNRAGHFAEAKAALEFMLNAEMKRAGARNFYDVNFIERDLGVTLSADYAISVTRYFGDGTEESDSNAAGPNIEFDNWGLFLWALGDYVDRSGDTSILDMYWPKISAQVADLLVELIEPDTGLLQTDSSIWERHWNAYGSVEPETRKHFTYSNLCAYEGLKQAAVMAQQIGDAARTARYERASERIRAAVLEHLIITPTQTGKPTVAGNLEEMGPEVKYMDQAVVEAINTGLLSEHAEIASGTLAAFDEFLAIGPHSPGYFRNDDGTVYDEAEWVMIDLRTASARIAVGDLSRGKDILDWVTDQARHNYGLIPELFGRADGNYNSNTPMCGFGPGAYLMAIEEYYRAANPPG